MRARLILARLPGTSKHVGVLAWAPGDPAGLADSEGPRFARDRRFAEGSGPGRPPAVGKPRPSRSALRPRSGGLFTPRRDVAVTDDEV
jgi:hypothetical protein